MNRKLLAITLAFISSTVAITSCDDSNSDSEAINVKKLESIVDEKLKKNVDIDEKDLDGDGKKEYVVRYKSKEDENPLRIVILNDENGSPVVRDEIKNVGEDFEEIQYIDINDNGSLEIIAGVKAGESLSKGLSIYEYKNGKTVEIFQEYYSKYMLEDIDGDGKKEIVIIKEKEKEDKSYAYLYRWKEDSFENTKKVEIDSTLDTNVQIFAKLLEE